MRALTRRVDAPEAQILARRGAELMTVPLEVGHKGELVNAFRGSRRVWMATLWCFLLLSMFPSGLPGIALLLLCFCGASWPIVVFFARIIAPLAMAIQFAGAWVALLGPRRPKRNAYNGKSSGVVNLPSGDNAIFLLVAALMAGVAIGDWAFESTASAIH